MKKILSLFDGSMIRFIIVGVINTVIGTTIMFGMYNLLGINYWISTASNYILVSILSYYLNKHFTFKNKEKDKEICQRVLDTNLIWDLFEKHSFIW